MYAVIKTGGKQYRVKAGDVLVVEKLDGDVGAKVAFNEVLMLGAGEAVTVGAPTVEGAVVDATLIETRKGEKIKVFKKIRRQGYRRTRGHRQQETVLRVTGISGQGQSETWDGVIDFTTRAELNARARGLKFEGAHAPVVAEDAAPAPAVEAAAEAPAKKPARKKAEPKTDAPEADAPATDTAADGGEA
jgi:large subunit ribosomal protein L21